MSALTEARHTLAVRDAVHGPFRCADVRCCPLYCIGCDDPRPMVPNIEHGEWRCADRCGYTTREPEPTEADEEHYWANHVQP
jgi:hypothetical protein